MVRGRDRPARGGQGVLRGAVRLAVRGRQGRRPAVQHDHHPGAERPTGGLFDSRGEFPGYAIFYVGVEDVAATLAKAESLGGKTVLGPITTPTARLRAAARRPRPPLRDLPAPAGLSGTARRRGGSAAPAAAGRSQSRLSMCPWSSPAAYGPSPTTTSGALAELVVLDRPLQRLRLDLAAPGELGQHRERDRGRVDVEVAAGAPRGCRRGRSRRCRARRSRRAPTGRSGRARPA